MTRLPSRSSRFSLLVTGVCALALSSGCSAFRSDSSQGKENRYQTPDLDVLDEAPPIPYSEVYVPVDSHAYKKDGQKLALSSTLVLRNTNRKVSLVVKRVDLYGQNGKRLRRVADEPFELRPFASVEFLTTEPRPDEVRKNADPDEVLDLDVDPRRSFEDIRLELARASTGEGRAVQHVSVEVGRLSEVPKELDVVLVFDRSHSLGGYEVDGQVRAAMAYLSHAPHARVQAVSFARHPRTEFPRFVDGKAAVSQLGALQLVTENGSDVERGLLQAQELLEDSKSKHRRVVLFTDALTASRITPARLAAISGDTGALLHVGLLGGGGPPEITANGEHAWRQVAEKTGGLVWETRVPSESTPFEVAARVFEEWMRPVRVHDVRIGINAEAPLSLGTSMAEGDGFAELSIVADTDDELYFRGKLWAKPVARGASVDRGASTKWASLVFGDPMHGQLSEDEMFLLAQRSNAVSPVTSLLAIEPGVRPSTEGIDWEGSVTGVGQGFGMGSGRIMLGGHRASHRFNHQEYLTNLTEKHWQACGGKGAIGVNVETTLSEIVDIVDVSGIERPDSVAEKCVKEGLFSERLSRAFSRRFESFAIVGNHG